jgi:putrescine transport system substrate-binding protein
VLPGPELARSIAAHALRKLDRKSLPNIGAAAPAIAAKLAVFDPGNAYAVDYMWFATGLLFDADKMSARLHGAPDSWALLFSPEAARKVSDCGIAVGEDRDDLFGAAWRFLGVAAQRPTLGDAHRAGDLLLRLKAAGALQDAPGALAGGVACIGIGRTGDVQRTIARVQNDQKPDIRMAIPREGAPMSLDALAIPAVAPNPAAAYAFIDFLLRKDVADRNAQATGLRSGDDAGDADTLKRLYPVAAFDATLAALVDKEWTRVRTAK